MEALDYLHSKNVYYGDMKPENLLVFRDFKVKLGDLGVSVKIPENDSDQNEIYLKGMTNEYSLEEVKDAFADNAPVPKQLLWDNDNYSLWKTFDKIFNQFKTQIPPESYFY